MRKQEYIHLHRLLLEATQHIFEQEDIPSEIFAEYNDLDVRPVNVALSKREHREAVLELAAAIETGIERTPTDEPDVPMT